MKVLGKERLEEFKTGKKQYNCVKCKEKICDIDQSKSRSTEDERVDVIEIN